MRSCKSASLQTNSTRCKRLRRERNYRTALVARARARSCDVLFPRVSSRQAETQTASNTHDPVAVNARYRPSLPRWLMTLGNWTRRGSLADAVSKENSCRTREYCPPNSGWFNFPASFIYARLTRFQRQPGRQAGRHGIIEQINNKTWAELIEARSIFHLVCTLLPCLPESVIIVIWSKYIFLSSLTF